MPLGAVIALALLGAVFLTVVVMAVVFATLPHRGNGADDKNPITIKKETEASATETETSEALATEAESSEAPPTETPSTEPPSTETPESTASGEDAEYASELAGIDLGIGAQVSSLVSSYVDEEGYFEPDDATLTEAAQKVYAWAQEQADAGVIEGSAYCEDSYSVSFFLPDGGTVVYMPSIRDFYTGSAGDEDICIGVMDEVPLSDKVVTDSTYKNPADTIKKEISTASSEEFDTSMTLNDLKTFLGSIPSRNVRAVFWRGHGGVYTARDGSTVFAFCTREKVTAQKEKQYEQERMVPEDGSTRLIVTSGKMMEYYAITYKLFEKYLPAVSAALCALLLLFLLIDAIWPKAELFLSEIIKWIVLIVCVAAACCGLLLIRRDRRMTRRRMR